MSRVTDATTLRELRSVKGNSRCPADAVCIQGGDAVVRIEASSSGGTIQPYDLHTGDMRPVRHGRLTIALVQLTPYPLASPPLSPSDYRATPRVTIE